MLKKWQEHSFVSDNERGAIAEIKSARLEKLDLIQKSKFLETTYKKCAQLLWNSIHVTYAVLLIHAQKC